MLPLVVKEALCKHLQWSQSFKIQDILKFVQLVYSYNQLYTVYIHICVHIYIYTLYQHLIHVFNELTCLFLSSHISVHWVQTIKCVHLYITNIFTSAMLNNIGFNYFKFIINKVNFFCFGELETKINNLKTF